jgi:hypothetical protein
VSGKMAMRVLAPALSAVVLLGGISIVSYASIGAVAGGSQARTPRSTVVEKVGQSQVPPCNWIIKPTLIDVRDHRGQKETWYRPQGFCAG